MSEYSVVKRVDKIICNECKSEIKMIVVATPSEMTLACKCSFWYSRAYQNDNDSIIKRRLIRMEEMKLSQRRALIMHDHGLTDEELLTLGLDTAYSRPELPVYSILEEKVIQEYIKRGWMKPGATAKDIVKATMGVPPK